MTLLKHIMTLLYHLFLQFLDDHIIFFHQLKASLICQLLHTSFFIFIDYVYYVYYDTTILLGFIHMV